MEALRSALALITTTTTTMDFRVNTPSHNTTVEGIDDFNIDGATGDLYLKNASAGTVGFVPSRSLEGWFDDRRVV